MWVDIDCDLSYLFCLWRSNLTEGTLRAIAFHTIFTASFGFVGCSYLKWWSTSCSLFHILVHSSLPMLLNSLITKSFWRASEDLMKRQNSEKSRSSSYGNSISSLMITGTQWLAIASNRRLEEGVSPARWRQNLDPCMPIVALLIPPLPLVPASKCTPASSFNNSYNCCRIMPPCRLPMKIGFKNLSQCSTQV